MDGDAEIISLRACSQKGRSVRKGLGRHRLSFKDVETELFGEFRGCQSESQPLEYGHERLVIHKSRIVDTGSRKH